MLGVANHSQGHPDSARLKRPIEINGGWLRIDVFNMAVEVRDFQSTVSILSPVHEVAQCALRLRIVARVDPARAERDVVRGTVTRSSSSR